MDKGIIDTRIKQRLDLDKQKIAELSEQLNKPITFIEKMVVDGCYSLFFDVFGKWTRTEVDKEAAMLANERYGDYFPETLKDSLDDFLGDPKGYVEKVEEYERICPPVEVEFRTWPEPFKLITRDPSRRMQEILAEMAVLSNYLAERGRKSYYALDIGTGYGRLARAIEAVLRYLDYEDKDYRVFGTDLSVSNIEDAKNLSRRISSDIVFLQSDMNKLPFPSHTFDLVNTADAGYLNLRHRRPFYIAEIARVISTNNGRGCISNPNEYTTLKEYLYVMMRTNSSTYMNPMNIVKILVLGPCVIHLDDLVKQRVDWKLTTTQDMVDTLKDTLKAEMISVNNWPEKGGPSIYSGYTFGIGKKTKSVLKKYIEYREAEEDAKDWVKVD